MKQFIKPFRVKHNRILSTHPPQAMQKGLQYEQFVVWICEAGVLLLTRRSLQTSPDCAEQGYKLCKKYDLLF
jgi:hypothetical protein